MNRNDVIDVLTKIAAFDRRTIGEGDIAAWQETIGHLDRDDALTAVTTHFRSSETWLMPVHLIGLARDIAHDRMMRETPAEREQRTAAIDAKTAQRRTAIQEFAGRTGRP